MNSSFPAPRAEAVNKYSVVDCTILEVLVVVEVVPVISCVPVVVVVWLPSETCSHQPPGFIGFVEPGGPAPSYDVVSDSVKGIPSPFVENVLVDVEGSLE
jgi:hypothetical protein